MSLNKLKNDYLLTGKQYGNTGAPIWVQGSFIPVCPVSGNEMRFLLQLNPPGAIKVSKTDVNFEDYEYPEYTEVLNFGNGVFYLFMSQTIKHWLLTLYPIHLTFTPTKISYSTAGHLTPTM